MAGLNVRPLTAVGSVLLLTCAVSAVRWVGVMRSDESRDATGYLWCTDQTAIGICFGVFYYLNQMFGTEDHRVPPAASAPIVTRPVFRWPVFVPPYSLGTHFFWFSSSWYPEVSMANQYYGAVQWSFPVWPLALICLMPATLRAWKSRRAKRAESMNRCGKCGYDLRATPTRCPECGTSVGTTDNQSPAIMGR